MAKSLCTQLLGPVTDGVVVQQNDGFVHARTVEGIASDTGVRVRLRIRTRIRGIPINLLSNRMTRSPILQLAIVKVFLLLGHGLGVFEV